MKVELYFTDGGVYNYPSMTNVTVYDARAVKTLEEGKERWWFKEWFESGINHREEDGCIVCDTISKGPHYYVEVDTLDEFIALQDKHECRISKQACKELPYYIHAYDEEE